MSSKPKLTELILYIGQTPIEGGRVGLAAILCRSDFNAYRFLGKPITEARYVHAREPGEPKAPRSLIRCIRLGWRWGALSHRIRYGRLTRPDAEWIADQWRDGVPS